jgi:hypothetical protein
MEVENINEQFLDSFRRLVGKVHPEQAAGITDDNFPMSLRYIGCNAAFVVSIRVRIISASESRGIDRLPLCFAGLYWRARRSE